MTEGGHVLIANKPFKGMRDSAGGTVPVSYIRLYTMMLFMMKI